MISEALPLIKAELDARYGDLKNGGKNLEAERLKTR
jgi:excinuclease UvrABC helicase subunit UvrB